MTVDFALNRKDNDIVFPINSNGFATLFVIDGADRIRQNIDIALKTWLRHWFLDQRIGVPYLEVIFDKRTRPATRESILRAVILSVAGVRQILDFSLDTNPATRVLTVNFIADTTQGTVQGSTLLDKVR